MTLRWRAADILRVLDLSCETGTFPALDNGYVYLAATRLSLYRSSEDWALVFEVFGFSPREGNPSTHITTFASKLRNRARRDAYVSDAAYETYLARHPFDDSRFIYPFDAIDEERECVAAHVHEVLLRGRAVSLPTLAEYGRHGIALEDPSKVHLYEACRYIASIAREEVLATRDERRVNVPDELGQVLQLEEWQHPNVVEGEPASRLCSFQQLARMLETGDVREYAPIERPNTHWSNWPEGGSL